MRFQSLKFLPFFGKTGVAVGGIHIRRHEIQVFDGAAVHAGDLGENLGVTLARDFPHRSGLAVAVRTVEKLLVGTDLEGLATGGADLLAIQVWLFKLSFLHLDDARAASRGFGGMRGWEGRVGAFDGHIALGKPEWFDEIITAPGRLLSAALAGVGGKWHPGGMDTALSLLQPLLEGRPRALARAITWMENGHPEARELMALAWPHLGRAVVVGITGAPGAGKSTLTDALARLLLAEGLKVGILAVDPSSPFSGGAILGDRIRMGRIATLPGVFIRSMATRGALGGLARATQDAIDLLDAAGWDVVIVETVGVGQDEVDVVSCVQTCCVVLVPGMGDEIQAIKAGIMEVADLFIINKADRDGVEKVEQEIEGMKSLSGPRDWDPPVLRTVAGQGAGVPELLAGIRAHGAWLTAHGGFQAKAQARARWRFGSLLAEEAARRALSGAGAERVEALIQAIADRTLDPYAAVAEVLKAAGSMPSSL